MIKTCWRVCIVLAGILSLAFGSVLTAGAAGNGYTPGTEGVMAATIPPPGFHYRMYNTYVDADTLTDKNGDELNVGFDLTVFAQAHRFVWITKQKLFGADYGMSAIVPLISTDFNVDTLNIHDSETGLGDIFIEPLVLGWYGERYDIGLGLGLNLPTGKFSRNEPASCGNGYVSGLLTLGGTYYLDDEKAWTASALTRTLVYGEQEETDVTPGWEFIVDWGIGKQFPLTKGVLARPGICGYTYHQLGEDHGPGTAGDKGRNFAIGAEVNLFWLPPCLFQANLRVLKEFGAKDEAESTKVVLTLSKSF